MALKIKASGVPRGSPLARLCLLSSCEERRWPSGQTFVAVCPRIKNAVLLKRTSNARPHPFVRVSARSDKRMQKRPRGSPGPQMVSRVFLNRCSYNKGARGPRVSGWSSFYGLKNRMTHKNGLNIRVQAVFASQNTSKRGSRRRCGYRRTGTHTSMSLSPRLAKAK